MVWGGGLMSAGGAVSAVFGQVIDFAGGTVVEIASGTAALVLVLILGNRHGFGKDPGHRPHNIPFIMLGAGILWFGWFGFNAGAATTVEQAGLIWVNTLAAPAAAMISWLVTEKVRHGHPTSLGAASGAVAGLVAITPSCANISPLAALGLGLVAGAACAVFVDLKFKFGFDDSLDVVGVHLGGGLIGTLALGLIALPVDGAGGGLFYGGGLHQLIAQTVAVLITVARVRARDRGDRPRHPQDARIPGQPRGRTRRSRPVRARRDRLRLCRTGLQPVQPVRPPRPRIARRAHGSAGPRSPGSPAREGRQPGLTARRYTGDGMQRTTAGPPAVVLVRGSVVALFVAEAGCPGGRGPAQDAGCVYAIRSKESTSGVPAGLLVTLSQSWALLEPSTVTRVRFVAAAACP